MRKIPFGVQLRAGLATLGFLRRRLGLRGAIAVAREIARAERRGEPFGHLPPPPDRREALSRQQVGQAVLLYRALLARLPRDEALALAHEILVAGGIIFLRRMVGPLPREEILARPPAEREAWVKELGQRFFSATMRWDEISEVRVRFTVTACRFPPLCREAGVPELAPSLCAGDAVYFGQTLRHVELIRPHTIAEGAPTCPFELRWR